MTQLEKLLGVTKFAELVGRFITKPRGKPTLVSINDKSPPFNGAVNDFIEAVKSKKRF